MTLDKFRTNMGMQDVTNHLIDLNNEYTKSLNNLVLLKKKLGELIRKVTISKVNYYEEAKKQEDLKNETQRDGYVKTKLAEDKDETQRRAVEYEVAIEEAYFNSIKMEIRIISKIVDLAIHFGQHKK